VDTGPADWGRPLYERVLDAVRARPGADLLDVGCGAGRLCRLAADRGMLVTGVDSDPAQLERAAALVPEARWHRAEVHALPLPDHRAGAVSCVQVLTHVPNPLAALRELARVAAPGAPVVVTTWGPPEQCAVGAFGAALAPVLGRPNSGDRATPAGGRSGPPGTPPLSDQGRLAKLARLAGLRAEDTLDVRCGFEYPDERALLASLYAAELGRRAVELVGRQQVRRAVLAGMAEHRLSGGGYRLENTFRLLVACA
jgi:SAM-dependent methyltransferase